MKKINTIVIAAGGRGLRLAEYFKLISFYNTKTLFPIRCGKSTLECLIDSALNEGYEKIFILAGFYYKEIKFFIDTKYKDTNIFIVFCDKNDREMGVTKAISLIEDKINKPFVYADGDIFFEPGLLKYLSNLKNKNKNLATCVVSLKDEALTHSKFVIENKKLKEIIVRCFSSTDKQKHAFCSLGLMVVNNELFKVFPEYKKKGDLDLVIKEIFDKDNKSINYFEYRGGWLSIHTKYDIDKINKGYYNVLKIFNNSK